MDAYVTKGPLGFYAVSVTTNGFTRQRKQKYATLVTVNGSPITLGLVLRHHLEALTEGRVGMRMFEDDRDIEDEEEPDEIDVDSEEYESLICFSGDHKDNVVKLLDKIFVERAEYMDEEVDTSWLMQEN